MTTFSNRHSSYIFTPPPTPVRRGSRRKASSLAPSLWLVPRFCAPEISRSGEAGRQNRLRNRYFMRSAPKAPIAPIICADTYTTRIPLNTELPACSVPTVRASVFLRSGASGANGAPLLLERDRGRKSRPGSRFPPKKRGAYRGATGCAERGSAYGGSISGPNDLEVATPGPPHANRPLSASYDYSRNPSSR